MRHFRILILPLLLAGLCLGACQSKDAAISLSIVGSSSVEPLVTILTDLYHDAYPDVDFDIQATGSSAGIKSALAGTTDIGMSSRVLTPNEHTEGLEEITIALDGIAVVVNPENPVDALTQEQVTAIFNGSIRNWKELGGFDRPIVLVSREAGSGTRDAFEEMIGLLVDHYSLLAEDAAIYCDSTNSIAHNVADKTNAIGYVSLGSLGANVKALRIDGIECAETTIEDGSYPLARPFTLLVNHVASQGHESQIDSLLDFFNNEKSQRTILDEGFVPVGISRSLP